MHGGECSDGVCGRCHAVEKVVIGALVLLNIYVWPMWKGGFDQWVQFFAALLIIKGVLKFIMPGCPHCKGDASGMKMGVKKGK